MNKEKSTLLKVKYLTRLNENEIYRAIANYNELLSAINQATTRQTISQTDYFRIKYNFDHIEDLIDDLLTISRFNYLQEVKVLYASIVENFNELFSKYVIDYTASDSVETRAYHKLAGDKQLSLTSYSTSYVIVDDKFVIFVPVKDYKYPALTELVHRETNVAVESPKVAEQPVVEEIVVTSTVEEIPNNEVLIEAESMAIEETPIESTSDIESIQTEMIDETIALEDVNNTDMDLNNTEVLGGDYLELTHYTSLPEEDLLHALTKYSDKLNLIKNNFKRQTVSQADFFRTKQNLNDIQELLDDLLSHKKYSFKAETKQAYDNIKHDFNEILDNLVIDYNAEDKPENDGLALLNQNENDLLKFQTSFVVHNDKQVVFNISNPYPYSVLGIENAEPVLVEQVVEEEPILIETVSEDMSVAKTDLDDIDQLSITSEPEIVENNDELEQPEEQIFDEDVQADKNETKDNVTLHEVQTYLIDADKKLKPTRYMSNPKKFWWLFSLVFVSLILLLLIIFVGLRAYELIANVDIF
ncbi:hypothetical protein [Mycoplasma sp. HS2188]|uniref:hypothetical protein n=1 Tax=Mycoplasma sp. HS2188 TaxID=2976765 RepID=UPI0021AA85BE|nr:hypothetical protein [Mycoplasma sp. HS2188]MCT4469395.1 hypothetical protein [Mycoplasma sp. HS2188]